MSYPAFECGSGLAEHFSLIVSVEPLRAWLKCQTISKLRRTPHSAIDRVRRVETRLQAGRPDSERLLVEIPWLDGLTAFTAPGRYVYFSRRLYERCATDEHVAFVIAHEIAHHDLRHVDLFAGWAPKIIGLPGASLFALAFHALERRLYGPEKECDADRHAIELCLAAGYDGLSCISLFDILEHYALDMGDLDIVHGPNDESDNELDEDAPWTTKAQIWAWQRKRGYLPIRDRRQMLLDHLQAINASTDRFYTR
jgi:predicted Zn-dependent protease